MIILEYVGAFVLDISMYFFVFEMMSVQSILKSESHLENRKNQREISKYRRVAIGLQSVAFAGLMFFYFDWNLLNQRYSRKSEFNYTFQAFKLLSFLMDILVLMLFWKLFSFFVNVKIEQRARNMGLDDFSGLTRKQKALIIWIIGIMVLNFFYLFFKCFIRAISNLTEPKQTPDLDTFDLIHQNRFLLFSVVDLLNGLSVLYSFYCVAELSTNQRHMAKLISFKSVSIKSRVKKHSSSVNTLKLNKILRGTIGEEPLRDNALLRPDNAAPKYMQNNKKQTMLGDQLSDSQKGLHSGDYT